MEFSWFGILKVLAIIGILVLLGWFIYSSQLCLGIFFLIVGIFGLFWARDYLEGQFSPERA
jgi:hypothetical protein